jgi:hypothetical protein
MTIPVAQFQAYLVNLGVPAEDVSSLPLAKTVLDIYCLPDINSLGSRLEGLEPLPHSTDRITGNSIEIHLQSKKLIEILNKELRELPEKTPPIERLPTIIMSFFIYASICFKGDSWHKLVLVPETRCYYQKLGKLWSVEFGEIFNKKKQCNEEQAEYFTTIWNTLKAIDWATEFLMRLACEIPCDDYNTFRVAIASFAKFIRPHEPTARPGQSRVSRMLRLFLKVKRIAWLY